MKDYQNYVTMVVPEHVDVKETHDYGQVCVFDGQRYTADIKLSEIENNNILVAPNEIYWMFSKDGPAVVTGVIPDQRVDQARSGYYNNISLHIVDDRQAV